ncbi:MAG: universal stress protein [Bacteroidota bacterium]
MKRINNILVPIDFSKCSKNALLYSTHLAELFQARLFLMHAYVYPVGSIEMSYTANDEFYQQIAIEAKEEMKVFEHEILSRTGIEYYTIFESGSAVKNIEQTVNNYHIDLVVMGTRGKSIFERFLFGGNAVSLIGKFNVPILVVPEKGSHFSIENLVFAYNFKSFKDLQLLDTLLYFADILNAKIHILHIASEIGESEKVKNLDNGSWISKQLKGVDHAYHFIQDNDIENAIWNHLEKGGGDLLVLKPRKSRKILEKLLSKSISREMVYHPHLPVLILQ